jgi:hypothetical protein
MLWVFFRLQIFGARTSIIICRRFGGGFRPALGDRHQRRAQMRSLIL